MRRADAGRVAGSRNTQVIITGLSHATTQILTHEPVAALQTLDSTNWSGSVWDSSPIIRTVALIDLGEPTGAADLVVGFGHQALRGRLPRMANDALIGFAALAINRGEHEHAWRLLQEAASPRTPFTISLAEGLADRISHGDELRRIHRDRRQPLSELDATDALRAELDRMRTRA